MIIYIYIYIYQLEEMSSGPDKALAKIFGAKDETEATKKMVLTNMFTNDTNSKLKTRNSKQAAAETERQIDR